MKAAIYARFSSDKQSDTSIEDQARVCHARANALGADVVAIHSDRAVSGATPVDRRPGGRELLLAAADGRFEILLLEGLDRLSRDSVEQETIVRRLEHRGVRIIGIADGYDSSSGKARKLLRGMRGLINETYLDDLREKIHRGLVGQLERGYHAGGLSFGYRSVVAGVDAHGAPIGHFLQVDEAQATVVREIFARYAAGESCQRIAAELNARAIRGPRGGTWCTSALYGSPAKGSGILNNELYVGRTIWNRSRWVKDPDTGKRQRLVRPESEWITEKRPDLRILDDEAWQAVRARMDKPRKSGGRAGRGGIPTALLTGVLRCGICGGAVVAVSGSHYGCSVRKDRGTAVCAGVKARRQGVDQALIGHLEATLRDPATIAWIENEAVARAAELNRSTSIADQRARQAVLGREIDRLTEAIATVGVSPALGKRLREAETELDAIKRAQARASVSALPSAVRARARALAADLTGALRQETGRAREALLATFGEIKLIPNGEQVFAEFDTPAERLMLAVGGGALSRVAGECKRTRIKVR